MKPALPLPSSPPPPSPHSPPTSHPLRGDLTEIQGWSDQLRDLISTPPSSFSLFPLFYTRSPFPPPWILKRGPSLNETSTLQLPLFQRRYDLIPFFFTLNHEPEFQPPHVSAFVSKCMDDSEAYNPFPSLIKATTNRKNPALSVQPPAAECPLTLQPPPTLFLFPWDDPQNISPPYFLRHHPLTQS